MRPFHFRTSIHLFLISLIGFVNSTKIVGHANFPLKSLINKDIIASLPDNLSILSNELTNSLEEVITPKLEFYEDNDFIKDKKLISISPGGFKGFYELGILSYIKDNYDLSNYIFSGASAGAWNALFMCYKHDTHNFIYNILAKNRQSINIKEVQYFLKYTLLSKYNTNDFDLDRLFIGVTTVDNFKLNTNIFSVFHSLEDAINCCIASSHIPFITGDMTNRYRDTYTLDGGFSKYPYLNVTDSVLHVSPSMWSKYDDNMNTNMNMNTNIIFKKMTDISRFCSLFSQPKNSNFLELYDNGYDDAKKNKQILDMILL